MEHCWYFVEGECEKRLIEALKLDPPMLKAGKITIYNVIQKKLSRSLLMSVLPKTTVVLAFDTDLMKTDILEQNIALLRRYGREIRIIYLPQVRNFEDEIERCCHLEKAADLTSSRSKKDFKKDFCRMKVRDCRHALKRHRFNFDLMWSTQVPESVRFIKKKRNQIKNT
ncbi:MAG: hypothetical protein IKS69_02250, partial [Erysipelotrichaceae bacterium]|nr:hypothetical protein [Erysipelotrichaceae bacterium]